MKKLLKLIFLFVFGASGYYCIELLWRGYSHWTMALCGGISLVVLCHIDKKMTGKGIFKKCAAGCVAITSLEFIAGCIVNLILKMCVWDYSGVTGNVLGQICLPFMLIWFAMCIPVFGCISGMRRLRGTGARSAVVE